MHAEGAQVYECKAGTDGKLAWLFREPIATLMADGKTVGRHYAGPNWEHVDGSAVDGKAAGNAPGRNAERIAWLKLEVIAHRGSGVLAGVTTVQRINTSGGKLDGACNKAGASKARPTPRSMCSCERAKPRRRFHRVRRLPSGRLPPIVLGFAQDVVSVGSRGQLAGLQHAMKANDQRRALDLDLGFDKASTIS